MRCSWVSPEAIADRRDEPEPIGEGDMPGKANTVRFMNAPTQSLRSACNNVEPKAILMGTFFDDRIRIDRSGVRAILVESAKE